MKTALHLQDYEEFLSIEQIYSLIALASYSCNCFQVCSKAFIKLEAINNCGRELSWDAAILLGGPDRPERSQVSQEKREMYEKLAVDIFSKNPLNEQQLSIITKVECKFCGSSIPDYSTSCVRCNTKFLPCIASGKSIMDSRLQWTCKRCAHQAIKSEIMQYNNCPLCHFHIDR